MQVYLSPFYNSNFFKKQDETSYKHKNFISMYDRVSFSSMKKSNFEGIDLLVIEKFKAPIEKFNNNSDLQNWSSDEFVKIKSQDFSGRRASTIQERKKILKEWTEYFSNKKYPMTLILLVFEDITKNLKSNTDTLPPYFNETVFKNTLSEITNVLQNHPKTPMNFDKNYKAELRKFYFEENVDSLTWVKIPSIYNDRQNFDENLKKLRTLSMDTWCTNDVSAQSYLSDGNFYILLENNIPKIGIRTVQNEIYEIQDINNDGSFDWRYFDDVKYCIESEGLSYSLVNKQISDAEIKKNKFDKIKKELKPLIEKNDQFLLLKYLNFDPSVKNDGSYSIEAYNQPYNFCKLNELGIDENKLFENVSVVKGNADFRNSDLINTGKTKYIYGNAIFTNSKITDLNNLEYIGGDAIFSLSNVKNLGKLKKIEGNANFKNSKVKDTGNLEFIAGDAIFTDSNLLDLPNLKYIGKNAYFNDSKINNIGNLRFIEGSAWFNNSNIRSLNNLESVNGSIFLENSHVNNLGHLKLVGRNIFISNSDLSKKDFNKIKYSQII